MPPWVVDDMTMGDVELALDEDTGKPRLPEGFKPMDPIAMSQMRFGRRTVCERLAKARKG